MEQAESFDAVLATGRAPATAGLGLEAAGIAVDDRGFVVVDEALRTSADGIYAVGDVTGGAQQTYLCLDDFRIVADHRWGAGRRTTTDRVAVPTVIYTTPPLARVGLNERQARERGGNLLLAAKSAAAIAMMPRPKIDAEPRGLVKFVVDGDTERILGATLLHGADEVINLIALAMRHDIAASELRQAIYTHPSYTEGLNEVLGELHRLG